MYVFSFETVVRIDFRTLNLKMCFEIMYNNHLVMNIEKKERKKEKKKNK